jgi:hypothetical protein
MYIYIWQKQLIENMCVNNEEVESLKQYTLMELKQKTEFFQMMKRICCDILERTS